MNLKYLLIILIVVSQSILENEKKISIFWALGLLLIGGSIGVWEILYPKIIIQKKDYLLKLSSNLEFYFIYDFTKKNFSWTNNWK